MIPVWSRLRDMKCPKCAGTLKTNLLDDTFDCTSCVFSIGTTRFNEIVNSIYKGSFKIQRVPDEMDNMSLLNNFDRPEMSKDYSDSPPDL